MTFCCEIELSSPAQLWELPSHDPAGLAFPSEGLFTTGDTFWPVGDLMLVGRFGLAGRSQLNVKPAGLLAWLLSVFGRRGILILLFA